jgi:hypothetical protein
MIVLFLLPANLKVFEADAVGYLEFFHGLAIGWSDFLPIGTFLL